MNPFEFFDELYVAKTRVRTLSVSEAFVILSCFVLIQSLCVTDNLRTDRQTDIPTVASTLFSVVKLSYVNSFSLNAIKRLIKKSLGGGGFSD